MPPSAPPSTPSRPSSGAGRLARAISFSSLGDAAALGHALEEARARVGTPAGLVLFATGAVAEAPQSLLETVRTVLGPVPTVLAAGLGVRTEAAEHEGCSAMAGLAFGRGRAHTVGLGRDSANELVGSELAEQVRAGGLRSRTLMLFGQANCLVPGALSSLCRAIAPTTVFGAGTANNATWRMTSEGHIESGAAAGLVLCCDASPTLRSSTACRLITPLAPITAAQGSLVLTIDGRPALSVLSDGARSLVGQPLVLAVLAEHSPEGASTGDPVLVVRSIRGVDPARQAIVVGEEVQPGMFIAFGTLDATSARVQLDRTLRGLARELAGGAPEFGLMLSCARRGRAFYQSMAPESSLFRERFPRIPMAGLLAPFEVAPFGNTSTVHLYSAVIAMFAAPS